MGVDNRSIVHGRSLNVHRCSGRVQGVLRACQDGAEERFELVAERQGLVRPLLREIVPGLRGTTRTTSSILLGLARAGRVDQRTAASRRGRPPTASNSRWASAKRCQIVGRAAPADVRIAAHGAEAGAGRVDQHEIERLVGKRQRAVGDVHHPDVRARGSAPASAQQPNAVRPHVGRNHDSGRRRGGAEGQGLSARRRAQIEDRGRARSAARSPISCDASSWTMQRPSRKAAVLSARPSSDRRVRWPPARSALVVTPSLSSSSARSPRG